MDPTSNRAKFLLSHGCVEGVNSKFHADIIAEADKLYPKAAKPESKPRRKQDQDTLEAAPRPVLAMPRKLASLVEIIDESEADELLAVRPNRWSVRPHLFAQGANTESTVKRLRNYVPGGEEVCVVECVPDVVQYFIGQGVLGKAVLEFTPNNPEEGDTIYVSCVLRETETAEIATPQEERPRATGELEQILEFMREVQRDAEVREDRLIKLLDKLRSPQTPAIAAPAITDQFAQMRNEFNTAINQVGGALSAQVQNDPSRQVAAMLQEKLWKTFLDKIGVFFKPPQAQFGLASLPIPSGALAQPMSPYQAMANWISQMKNDEAAKRSIAAELPGLTGAVPEKGWVEMLNDGIQAIMLIQSLGAKDGSIDGMARMLADMAKFKQQPQMGLNGLPVQQAPAQQASPVLSGPEGRDQ